MINWVNKVLLTNIMTTTRQSQTAQIGPLYLGVDLGGTKILALVGTADGHVLSESLVSTPSAHGVDPVIVRLINAVSGALASAKVGLSSIAGVGVAAAGAVDHTAGIVVHSPHLAGWDHVPLATLINHSLGVPVVIDNDANLAALGEHRYGTGRGISNLLYVTVSTGIGGGIIINGDVYRGATGYAGEVGHISVSAGGPYGKSRTAGALEALAAGTALVREALRRLDQGEPSQLRSIVADPFPTELTAEEVFQAFHQGDNLATQVVSQGVHYLGAGLTSLVNVLSPEVLIIGGGLSNQWKAYIEPAVKLMREQVFAGSARNLRVSPPELGIYAGALGAIALASERNSNSPKVL